MTDASNGFMPMAKGKTLGKMVEPLIFKEWTCLLLS
jgi:hypothetical protein